MRVERLCIILAAAVLVALAAYVVGFFRELKELQDALEHNTPLAEKKFRFAALEDLAKSIVRNQERLKETYSMKMVTNQSRINALQSQINPHFLYNTLECIRSEAVTEHCGSIAKMSKALASFFRYSISRRENIVTIQDELNNINNYLLIQSYRFGDRFDWKFEIEENDDLYDCLIPKMTIQPVVENSIFHGLEPKGGKGEVSICVRATEETILMLISDNGVGMDRQTLAHMKDRIELVQENLSEKIQARGNGIALLNVNQRIKLTFGENYGMQIYSTQGEGTSVEIIFPIVREREKLRIYGQE